jgi:hypothetical protein
LPAAAEASPVTDSGATLEFAEAAALGAPAQAPTIRTQGVTPATEVAALRRQLAAANARIAGLKVAVADDALIEQLNAEARQQMPATARQDLVVGALRQAAVGVQMAVEAAPADAAAAAPREEPLNDDNTRTTSVDAAVPPNAGIVEQRVTEATTAARRHAGDRAPEPA